MLLYSAHLFPLNGVIHPKQIWKRNKPSGLSLFKNVFTVGQSFGEPSFSFVWNNWENECFRDWFRDKRKKKKGTTQLVWIAQIACLLQDPPPGVWDKYSLFDWHQSSQSTPEGRCAQSISSCFLYLLSDCETYPCKCVWMQECMWAIQSNAIAGFKG